ncbi:MAG: HAMP domain-containing histidine kinase [Ruminococcus flavefaciens]|nr:HAMP domain-containing histidine kinase [Ruminococcus flavefaciens]
MHNNNSYNKFLRYSMFLMMSVIIILGVIIIGISSSICKQNELERLKNTGSLFISCIKKEYNDTHGSLKNENTLTMQRLFEEEHNIMIYIYDNDGKCLLSDGNDKEEKLNIPEIMKSYIDSGQYLDLNSEGISSKEPYLLYGDKFTMKRNGLPSENIYILIYGSTHNISMFTMEIFLIYSISAIIILFFLYLILKKKVRRYAQYKNDITRILKKYSQGDFSEKIRPDNTIFPDETAKYINTLASNVETSEETSKTFIANVSHELRTPITTIGGFVDGILDGTIPKNRRNEYLVLVSNEIQRLSILISSMLNMSRFESGTLKPNFQETNLTDLVIKTAFMFEKKIEAKNIEVEEFDSENLIAEVDPDLMQQVIYNLIENAVKFVNTGGKLSFCFEKEGNMCIVGIRNTGEGLKDSEIPQVFDRFYKTDSSRGKDTTGLGLGLSISRRILHINNGNIAVKSVYGEYTEFQIQVPEKQHLE